MNAYLKIYVFFLGKISDPRIYLLASTGGSHSAVYPNGCARVSESIRREDELVSIGIQDLSHHSNGFSKVRIIRDDDCHIIKSLAGRRAMSGGMPALLA
jgi:hypothetical protein